MEFIKPDIAIDFMGMRKKTGIVSGLACTASLLIIAIFGLNQGIDFKGGSAVIVSFKEGAATERAKLEASMHQLVLEETGDESSQISVQDFDIGIGADQEEQALHRFLVYTEVTSLLSDAKRQEITDKIKASFGAETRVDLPAEGADTFYVTFPEDVPVLERSAALDKLFQELGFDQTTIVSGAEEQLEIERAADLSLVLSEKDSGDTGFDEQVVTDAAWKKQKQKKLEGKSDRRFKVSVEELKAKVTQMLSKSFGDDFVRVESSTSVSPSVGRDLLNNGLLAVLYAIIGILVYISLRFDFRFAPGAVVALVHDVLITLGIFAAFQVKFSLPIIAALLTIVGYSLNDTIVVLDRVRETFEAYRGRDLKDLLNRAINETLSRTTLTSATTLFVVISIVAVGGGLIRDFALALLIGITVGTYSSIFIASPLVYYMDEYLNRRGARRAAK